MPKHGAFLGILFMILGSGILSSKDGIVKTIVDQVGPFQILWIQFAGSFLVMALLTLPSHGWVVVRPSSPGAQFIRGALNVGAVSAFFWALKYIPLADATALLLFAPVVATVLSPLVLGEKIGRLRITAALFGFCGVIVMLRPGFAGDPTGYYFGLAAGILLGCYFMANRRLAGSQHFMLNITHNTLMGALALTPLMFFVWEPIPDTVYLEFAFIVGMGLIGQGFLISSFKFGPAAVISPYSYTMLIFSTLFGYLVFNTIPDMISWFGMALIVGSGIYIAHRERQLAKIG